MAKAINLLKDKKTYNKLKFTGIIFIPVILFFIPVSSIAEFHSICLFKNITGIECYGCGMTRAILSALHFQFNTAFQFNKLFIIVYPLLIFIWIKALVTLKKKI